MKFKVGDTVKVREDLKLDSFYGSDVFVEPMDKHPIITIKEINHGKYISEQHEYNYTDEMLEGLYIEKEKVLLNDLSKTEVVIAEPFTTLIDKEKITTVKTNGEEFNYTKGIIMALLQHKLGLSYSKLKYLLHEMKKGDEEAVLGRFLLREAGIKMFDIKKLINKADIKTTNEPLEKFAQEIENYFNWVAKQTESTKTRKMVAIIDNGECYTSYVEFFDNNGLHELKERYAKGRIIPDYVIYKIVGSGFHEHTGDLILILEHPVTKAVYLVNECGVKYEDISILESSPLTKKVFGKTYRQLDRLELKHYREYLKKQKKNTL